MKKAVIFDMDGVLIDSEYFYFKRRMKFFDSIEVEPAIRSFNDFIGSNDRLIWEKLIPNDIKKRAVLKEKYTKYREVNKINFEKVLNKSARELIIGLKRKNIKLAIASSSEKKEILRMLRECNLDEYIDFIISGEECKESKPSPEIYNRAVKALDVLPSEALVVEDSYLGITSAKSAGLGVAALTQDNCNIDQSQADYHINDLKSIFELI